MSQRATPCSTLWSNPDFPRARATARSSKTKATHHFRTCRRLTLGEHLTSHAPAELDDVVAANFPQRIGEELPDDPLPPVKREVGVVHRPHRLCGRLSCRRDNFVR